jgi:hypothetical protein
MQRFYPQLYLSVASTLETLQRPHNFPDDEVIPDYLRDSGLEALKPLTKDLADLDLRASAITLERFITLLSKKGCTVKQQSDLAKELDGRIVDEMSGQSFFYLSVSEAWRYDHWEDGWKSILECFPEATRDVEEMNKCFAFSRYTASMFHALHVAEWGSISLGDYIGVTDPKKGWGPTERKLRELIKSNHENLPSNLKGKFEFLEQMSREIDSMVLAWRHKVDHAANRLAIVPNAEFTPDIAEHIIGAVRIFMQRLCEGIPA